MDKKKNISGWGKYPKQKEANCFNIKDTLPNKLTIRGNGRSYGDAAIGKNILSTLKLNNEISFDTENEILTCDSGVLLRDILNHTIPLGYTVPVMPGTQFVTLGGMVAADVHGKNHFKNGSIGNWIKEICIENSEGKNIWCSDQKNTDLFNATIGGMGLTGLIIQVKIKLTPLKSHLFIQKTVISKSLDNLIELLENNNSTYQVAWIDLLNKKPKFLHFSANESSTERKKGFQLKKPQLSFPKFPISILSAALMKIYNRNYFRKSIQQKETNVDFNQFFFPLDKFNNWNNLYGPNGMIQYQFILPKENAIESLNEILEIIKISTFKPYLSVLKKYKKNTSPGLLSFPIEGYSLALDFPYKEGLTSFLNQIDQKVIENKGRIYLAKDACLKSGSLEKMYPKLNVLKKSILNYNYSSNLASRLNLK